MRPAMLASLALAALGCTAPEGRFRCTTGADCPSGWSCRADQRCWASPGGDLDASIATDASTRDAQAADARTTDAPAPDDGGPIDAPALGDATGDASCGDTTSDPLHCGSCDHACELEHAVAACTESSCTIDVCETGFDDCDEDPDTGCEIEVASDPEHCGSCTAPPCAGACTDGVCVGGSCRAGSAELEVGGETRCSAFGGAYLQLATGACIDGNAFAPLCTCPAGFTDVAIEWTTPMGVGEMNICVAPGTAPSGGWGGIYAEQPSTATCVLGNDRAGGACACPAGYLTSERWRGTGSAGRDLEIVFCTSATPDPDGTFTGAYTQASIACGGMCFAVDGTCACPAGSSLSQLAGRTIVAGAACDATSTFCYRLP